MEDKTLPSRKNSIYSIAVKQHASLLWLPKRSSTGDEGA
jgi:hypothetical protein